MLHHVAGKALLWLAHCGVLAPHQSGTNTKKIHNIKLPCNHKVSISTALWTFNYRLL
jgi:hypothetical protein